MGPGASPEAETIAAIATPPGRGGISVVRVSGPRAREALTALTGIPDPTPRHAYYREFSQKGELLDRGIALFFPAPHSYTGEDVAEFQGHGGAIAPQRTLAAVLSLGVRMAEPGEFTRRAYLNGRMDLTEAEAVEDLISASTKSAARAAIASLSGAFASRVNTLLERLTDLRARLEACLDFPEEHEEFLQSGEAVSTLVGLGADMESCLAAARQGQRLASGLSVVLVGAPNAGKSSLMNALAGEERAIVTAVPGTTRDVLRVDLEIRGFPVRIADTAGLRRHSEDVIERMGMERARAEIERAGLVLLVIDGSSPCPGALALLAEVESLAPSAELMVVRSKSDLGADRTTSSLLVSGPFAQLEVISTTTRAEDGVDALLDAIANRLGTLPEEGAFSARARHLEALGKTHGSLRRALMEVQEGDLVLAAEELRDAQETLGTITGKVTPDDLLGRIFNTFCLGK
ncbi:MAG: tRNA uridine-5-carboxymethylaminomethyl(34) synthesis GTPase MnmE [Succinivibrionaceae bacterium]|nr:tRNA uridine-5-carboxymethylaminomethyl(34) synthesis GTPase MnmE [Succinivibrionaceae bacterium]